MGNSQGGPKPRKPADVPQKGDPRGRGAVGPHEANADTEGKRRGKVVPGEEEEEDEGEEDRGDEGEKARDHAEDREVGVVVEEEEERCGRLWSPSAMEEGSQDLALLRYCAFKAADVYDNGMFLLEHMIQGGSLSAREVARLRREIEVQGVGPHSAISLDSELVAARYMELVATALSEHARSYVRVLEERGGGPGDATDEGLSGVSRASGP